MSVLTNTKLETHPATTPAKNSIINANWQQLENIFDPTLGTGDPVYQLILKALVKNASPTLTDGYMLVYRTGTTRLNLELVDVGNAIKIQGRSVVSTAPTDGQAYVWNNTASQWEPQDVSAGDATSIQGYAVENAAPADGESLIWVAANSQYEPGAPAGNATQIQGRAVDTGAPTDAQVYIWDNTNSKWIVSDVNATKIQGRAVSSAAPSDTQAMVWNNSLSQWEPQNQTGSGGGSGGLTVQNGGIVQRVIATDATYRTLSTAIPVDDTIPQNTEGTEIMTRAITPKNENSKLVVIVRIVGVFLNATNQIVAAALFKDSGADSLAAGATQADSASNSNGIVFQYEESAGSTAARTFKVRVGPNSGTAYLHGNSSARRYGGVMVSSIEVLEVLETGQVLAAPPWIQQHPDARPATPATEDDEFEGTSLDAKWTWENQGSSTVAFKNSRLVFTGAASTTEARVIYQTAPSTPYRVTVKLAPDGSTPATNHNVGIGFEESSTGKLHIVGISDNDTNVRVQRWTDSSTYSSSDANAAIAERPAYLRIEDDGTDLKFHYSHDGIVFEEYYTLTRTTYMSGGPNRILLFCSAGDASLDAVAIYQYFRVDAGTDKAKEILLLDRTSFTLRTSTRTLENWRPLEHQPPASNYPTPLVRNDMTCLAFDDSTEETTYFLARIKENGNTGSGLRFQIQFAATSATSGDVVWGVAVMRCNTDLDTDSFDTAAEVTKTTNATAGIPEIAEISTTNIDGAVAGDLVRVKLYRKAADSGDTMTGDAELWGFEMQAIDEPDSKAGVMVGGIVTESTTSRTLAVADIGQYIRLTNASSCTITLPTDATAGWDDEAFPPQIWFKVSAAGIPTLSHSGVTVNDEQSIIADLATGSKFGLLRVGTNEWDVI